MEAFFLAAARAARKRLSVREQAAAALEEARTDVMDGETQTERARGRDERGPKVWSCAHHARFPWHICFDFVSG